MQRGTSPPAGHGIYVHGDMPSHGCSSGAGKSGPSQRGVGHYGEEGHLTHVGLPEIACDSSHHSRCPPATLRGPPPSPPRRVSPREHHHPPSPPRHRTLQRWGAGPSSGLGLPTTSVRAPVGSIHSSPRRGSHGSLRSLSRLISAPRSAPSVFLSICRCHPRPGSAG